MIKFFYIGIDTEGAEINGSILAKNKRNARILLNNRGVIIKSLYLKGLNLKTLFIKNDNFDLFIKSLSDLLLSGLPLTDSLQFISKGESGPINQNAGFNIFESIKNGDPLYSSIENHFPEASKFHLSLIESGEKSGKLDQALSSISEMINEDRIMKSELIGSLTYPFILLVTMIGLIFFILEFALPKILNVMDMNEALPLPTKILIASGNIIPNLIIILSYIFLFISIIIIFRNRFNIGKNFIDLLIFKIPLLKQGLIITGRRRILQGFSIGLKGGLSIPEVINLVANSMPNYLLKNQIHNINVSLEEGERFSNALEKTNILTLTQLASIKIGDETDKLSENFLLLKVQFEKNLSIHLKTTVKIIEPLMILIFGFIILILALGIILPVLDATSMVNI